MKIIPYFLYLYLITFHMTILSDIISIYGVTVDLLILIVAMIGLYKSEAEAIWFGMAAGIIAAATRLDLMPWEVLVVVGIALAVRQVSTRINLESLASKALVLAGAVFFHQLIMTLLISTEESLFILLRYIIPGVAYTLIFGLIFFLIKDGRISWPKIKALF